jgi:hypothetical protein
MVRDAFPHDRHCCMTERSLPLQEEDTRLYSPVWKTGDIFIVPSAGTTGMRIGCRTPEGIRQDVASHTHHLWLSRRGQEISRTVSWQAYVHG